jgi:hypothetical protein
MSTRAFHLRKKLHQYIVMQGLSGPKVREVIIDKLTIMCSQKPLQQQALMSRKASLKTSNRCTIQLSDTLGHPALTTRRGV